MNKYVGTIKRYLIKNQPQVILFLTHEKWIKGLTIALVALIFILRGQDRLTYPQFVAEDGRVFFQDSYNLDLWRSITRFYNGGSYLLSRLIAEFSQIFRLELIPTIFVLSSLIVATSCCCIFLSSRFKWLVPSLHLRSLCCIMLALMPSSNELILRLVNAHWYLAIACFLLILMNIPRHFLGKILYALMWIISSLSAPLIVVFSPSLIVRAIIDQKNRLLLIALTAFLIGIAIVIRQENATVDFVQDVDASQASIILGIVNTLTYRVLLTCILGDRTAYELFHDNKTLLAYLPYLLTIAYGYIVIQTATNFIKRKLWMKLAIWTHIQYCVLAPLLLTFLGRPEILLQSQSIKTLWGSERYFFLPVGACLFGFFWWIIHVQPKRLLLKWAKLLSPLIVLPAFILDFSIANIWITDHQWLTQVERIKKAEIFSPGQMLNVPVNPTQDWSMTLRLPGSRLPKLQALRFMENRNSGYLDFVRAYGGGKQVVSRKRAVKAGGWAVDQEANRPAAEVLVIDKTSNQVLARTRVNLWRSDVAKALQNDRLLFSGWQVVFPIEQLQPGKHILAAYAFDPATMQAFPLTNEIEIEVTLAKRQPSQTQESP
jgi:hypothetical protein